METIMGAGVILLFTPLTMIYAVYNMVNAPSRWKKYLPYFVLAMALFAYCYNPVGEPDLERYFQQLEECGKLTLGQTIEWYHDGLIIENIIFWIIGRLGLAHLLPAISTGTIYAITGYITCDIASNHSAYKKIPTILLIQILILPFLSIVNNIRNIWAFSLIILAVYLELVKKKRNIGVLLLYILPCFLHMSAAILVVLRLLIIPAKRAKVLTIIGAATVPSLISLAYQYRNSIPIGGNLGIIIRQMIVKANWYLYDTNSTEWARAVSASGYQQMNRVVMMFIAVVLIVFAFYYMETINENEKDFVIFVFLLCVITLACNVFTTPQYWRFSAASIIGSGVLILKMLVDKKYLTRRCKVALYALEGLALVAFLLQLWRARYMMDFIDFFITVIRTNIYTVIMEFIYALFTL